METPTLVIPMFNSLSIGSFINAPVLIAILVVFFIAYTIASTILIYHWSVYGMRSPGVLAAETLFLFVSLTLFICSGLAISYF